jgi:hypothetical protein
MRTDKELLDLLLEEFPAKFSVGVKGLCACIRLLNLKETEKKRLLEIINENFTDYYINTDTGYYFTPRSIEQRQKYLKQLIQKYK